MNTIKLSDIIIQKDFLDSKTKSFKIEKIIKYYKKHKRLDKPIVLNSGILVDKYARYLAAKIIGLQEVPCVELQKMSYIVGKFDNNNKEYIWKNDAGFNINIGDKVLVKVKSNGEYKNVSVTVINLFNSDSIELYNKHKSVVSVLNN